MDSADKFSQKKKKDLVAIVTQFGLMTEEKANRLTKQDLVDFMSEQERRSSDVIPAAVPEVKASAPEAKAIPEVKAVPEVKAPKAIAAVPEVRVSAAPVVNTEASPEFPAPAPEDVPSVLAVETAAAESAAAANAKPVKKPAASGRKPARSHSDSKKEEAVHDTPAADPKTDMDASAAAGRVSEDPELFIAVFPEKEEPARDTSINEAAAVPEAEASTEQENTSAGRHRGRPKKKAKPEAEDSIITEEILSLPPQELSEEAPRIPEETKPAEESKPAEGQVRQTESAKPSAEAASEPSAKPHAGRSRKHSVIIKPKEERIEIDEVAEEVSDLLRDYREDQESIQENAEETSEPEAVESQSGNPSVSAHHNRTLRPKEPPQELQSGVLEIMSEGYGFLRRENYLQGTNDIYVPQQYVRRFQLRVGDFVVGPCRPKRDSDRYPALQYIKEVNGLPPEKMLRRPHFDRLTPIYPNEKFTLETEKNELSTRIIDLVAPIGKGQRGMIVSPPKAGKTILLQKIANAISINNPECKLIVLLIDERPEEVTDMQRSINGEVVYSTFDKTPENHVRITELVLERAMRLVELGQDVIVLLDSITRMSRAYNLTINPTGRTLSGGLDPGALYGPKRFFGAARNIEGGGSLTIIATSLIETGSRMDEVIFEEFKGTGNMEVCLDRKLSEKRIFPAIDIIKSGTRREELLLSPVELDAVWTIRKAFSQLDTAAVTEMIISLLLKTNSNNQFVQSVNVSFNDKATFDAMRGTRLPGGQNPGQNQSGK